jgi:hypothetical protein
VNVTAHVEKEIEMACVTPDVANNTITGDPAGPYTLTGYLATETGQCAYGTVFPQTDAKQTVEVTLSRSFFDQTTYSTVQYDVYWECKLYDENGLANVETNPCRNADGYDPTNFEPVGAPALDGNIRDYVEVTTGNSACLNTDSAEDIGGAAQLEKLGNGSVQTGRGKCFYDLTLHTPYCNGHFNPNTEDPAKAEIYKGVDCNFTIADGGTENDPQDWEHSTDLGDTFKIQVTGFVLAPS